MEYEERELILELFPGTSPDLLPIGEILYYRDEEGRVVILEKGPPELKLVLEPLPGSPATPRSARPATATSPGRRPGFSATPWEGTRGTCATWSSARTRPAAPATPHPGV